MRDKYWLNLLMSAIFTQAENPAMAKAPFSQYRSQVNCQSQTYIGFQNPWVLNSLTPKSWIICHPIIWSSFLDSPKLAIGHHWEVGWGNSSSKSPLTLMLQGHKFQWNHRQQPLILDVSSSFSTANLPTWGWQVCSLVLHRDWHATRELMYAH